MSISSIIGILFYLVIGIILWLIFFKFKKLFHTESVNLDSRAKKVVLIISIIITSLVCIIPMGLNSHWNEDAPDCLKQYEVMADSILNGRIDLDIPVNPDLSAMDNPYDTQAREDNNIEYMWDHAFYNGHYFMYFGVVPTFLAFIPYKIITGQTLSTYHATQFFVVIFIIGIFALFYLLARLFFKKMTFGIYILLSSAFAFMSVWISVGTPALYCTAITAALALSVWSILCFMWAAYNKHTKHPIRWLALGSLLGALTFGCRPTIALFNIILIPVLIYLFKKQYNTSKLNFRFILKVAIALLPYIIVGVSLMLYNYARFDSLLEFGQKYQLTVTDQSNYSGLSGISIISVLNGILNSFIDFNGFSNSFPFISFGGILIEFPILLTVFIGLSHRDIRNNIRRHNLTPFIATLLLIPIFIITISVAWSPFLIERYHMDIYFIVAIVCFIIIGCWCNTLNSNRIKNFSYLICVLACITIFTCTLLYFVPYDFNLVKTHPELLQKVTKVLTIGLSP